MKLNVARRIIREDFDAKDQPLIDKLASTINQFMEQVANGFNKNLTIEDNLPFETKTFTVTVDSNGLPDANVVFKTSLRFRGMMVINAANVQDGDLLVGAPFVQWSINGGLITIVRVLGLPVGKKCSLTVFLVG